MWRHKLHAIRSIIKSDNYIVITDIDNIGAVSPLYAGKYLGKINQVIDQLKLSEHRHNQRMNGLADDELGEIS